MTEPRDDDPVHSPSASPSTPPSPPIEEQDISLDHTFSSITLDDSPPPLTTQTPNSNGHLTPHNSRSFSRSSQDDFGPSTSPGTPGTAPRTPTRSPSPAPPLSPTAHRAQGNHQLSRVLTRSPSPGGYRQFAPRDARQDSLDASPSRVPLPSSGSGSPLSPPRSAPPLTLSFRDAEGSRSPGFGPTSPRYTGRHPWPQSVAVLPENGEDGDAPDAPFESIPLHSSTPPPPPPSASVPLPSSPPGALSPGPKAQKRRSWGGFGMTRDGEQVAAGVLPTHEPPAEGSVAGSPRGSFVSSRRGKGSVDLGVENGLGHGTHPNGAATVPLPTPGEASGSGASTPRRAAPPAHPFPWPIPSTPPPAPARISISSHSHSNSQSHPNPNPNPNPNRLSVLSNSSTHSAAPSTAPSTSTSAPHAPALGAKGISTFEKVVSHTRPSWLPPKDRAEDETHLHQWEEMMKQAREHEKERQRAAEIRRYEREKRLAVDTPRWEALLGAKDFSAGKVIGDEGLRKLWFDGVPSHLRGKAWALAIGNPLAVSKDAYNMYAKRARRGIEKGRFPPDVLAEIEADLDQTLVTLKLYGKGSPLRDDLREMICAWLVYRSDEGLGYAPYINLLSAMLLLVSPPSQAFISLINLLSRPCLRAFYTQTTDEIDAYYRVLENLQADQFPKIYANCKNLGLRVPESWFRSLLVEQLPFEASCRLWDQIMLDGDGYLFRAALAIFGFLEPRLYYPDHDEVLSVLEGHNPAMMAIAARERERARLKGEPYEEGVDGKLSSFGLSEGSLFEWLEKDGWKEKAFERLVVREMPD
ncbi:hypothetical protein IAT38_006578 [Cryptococcus sp. DSM 104549]